MGAKPELLRLAHRAVPVRGFDGARWGGAGVISSLLQPDRARPGGMLYNVRVVDTRLSKADFVSRDEYLGEFEHLVLLAILQLGTQAYGVPIKRLIEERGKRAVSFGAVYSTLRRLEKKGYVASSPGEPEPIPGGRAKKFFTLEDLGLEAVRRSQMRLSNMATGLRDVLGSEPG